MYRIMIWRMACLAIGMFSLTAEAEDWLEHHRLRLPPVSPEGICTGEVGGLPVLKVIPERPGTRIVRASVPFPPAALPEGMGVAAVSGDHRVTADVRPLTFHPGKPVSVRRALLTFPWEFSRSGEHAFALELDAPASESMVLAHEAADGIHSVVTRVGVLSVSGGSIAFEPSQRAAWQSVLIAPALEAPGAAELEWVEKGAHFLWIRLLIPDDRFPRILEVRLDVLGGVAAAARIQRMEKGNDTAPDLGWEISGLRMPDCDRQFFTDGNERTMCAEDATVLRFPRADKERRGYVEASGGSVRFLRCTRDEAVPFQESAWRAAVFAVDPADQPPRAPLLEYSLPVHVAPEALHRIYGQGLPEDLAPYPLLQEVRRFTHAALCRAAAIGDDFGNVTGYHEHLPHGGVHGMNRLNHAAAMFEEAWRGGNTDLLQTAVLWCDNMHDLSVWWGPGKDFGGTRYNNAEAAGEKEHEGDTRFMWRTNYASNFCTKGMDAFFLAYEETGDPRMLAALNAQVAYAREHVHVNKGEARNIGDVADFMHLYRYTGDKEYVHEALRLFRELRECLSSNHLFSQGGKPILDRVPFIDEDQKGMRHPFPKPYILGYALAGLPWLLEVVPDEPGLVDVVRSVARFMAEVQDPVGGWRYPHPDSSRMIIDQAMEHAAQLARAARVLHARGEPVGPLLDAIERTLRARIMGYAVSGTVLTALTGWEEGAGLLKEKSIYDLYDWPEDRDKTRDYSEGTVATGSSAPEGLAHYFEALRCYLEFRQPERLFAACPKLAQVLARLPDAAPVVTFTEDAVAFGVTLPPKASSDFKLALTAGQQSPVPASFELTNNFGLYRWCDAKGLWNLVVEPGPKMLTVSLCLQPGADISAGYVSFVWKVHPAAATPVIYKQSGPVPPDTYSHPGPVLMRWMGQDAVSSTILHFPHVVRVEASGIQEGAWEVEMRMPVRKDGHATANVTCWLDRDDQQRRAILHDILAERVEFYGYPPGAAASAPGYGMRALLPALHEARIVRMGFALAYTPEKVFEDWRAGARAAYIRCLLDPPPRAPSQIRVTSVEDRGVYECRKIAFNISADERISAYLLVPKGRGPFPAMLALHDHGAHFSIGKEKVVRPFDVPTEKLRDAVQWVNKYYGGKFIGDELAQRGYVVLAVDALFWGDRGRAEGPDHAAQQELASNLLLMGQCWAGVIVWNDLRCAELLAGLPEVAPDHIGAIGFSMGAHRTWNLCAATDIVRAGAAICWMGDTPTLTSEGNNQTRGQSAFSMTFPGLRNLLDYSDVASIACPKPMLFYNGTQDALFPVTGVESAYARVRSVYEAQDVGDRLETCLWEVPHEFNIAMQEKVFTWLDRWLKAGDKASLPMPYTAS